ncbi:MAG: arginine--tRNA ligase [Gemmatimonadetes bacterium]|nr:arginine--tRNA ligase [Gemmatimonadota bacterium]
MSGAPPGDPRAALTLALERALADMGASEQGPVEVRLERPRDPTHGDWATNVALTLAKRLGKNPRELATQLATRIDLAKTGLETVEVAGPGFLNFRLATASITGELARIVADDESYGRSARGAGEKIMVEWVSANPTGPLHFGHGRQAALGDAISALLSWTGWAVHREFYYNDAGKQMDLLAHSVRARYQQQLGLPGEIPEGGYQGEYIIDLAREFHAEVGNRYEADQGPDALDAFRRFAVKLLRAEQDRDLNEFRVHFDSFHLESSLYSEGLVARTIEALRATGHVYELDGAVWLRTTVFGDDKDRVMVRGTGAPTYFLPDVAYHVTKWERGFHRAINVQGADHHGSTSRVRAGLRALGHPDGFPEWVIHQMVRLEQDGKEVKFSKRAGAYTTLRELFEMVGVDVARYFFLMRKPEAQLLFDLDMALDQSEKNPVYKVQYAHARMCSIFGKAGEDETERAAAGAGDLTLLSDPTELALVKALSEFPEVVELAAAQRGPHLLCDYLEQTAGAVNSWYHAGNPSRNPGLAVLVPDPEVRAARLVLARAVRIVLRNGLRILNVSAPVRLERALEEAGAN